MEKVEEVDRAVGRDRYNPDSYEELMEDVARSVAQGLRDGVTRMEVEFPPLGSSLDSYKGQSDDYIDANIVLTIQLSKLLAKEGLATRILVPDEIEKRRAKRVFKTSLELDDRIVMGSLQETGVSSPLKGDWAQKVLGGFFAENRVQDFEGNRFTENTREDVFVVVNASCAELPTIKKYWEEFCRDKAMILLNLELDTLRGDLGLFGFPSKDIHYGFLSHFKPMFFLRNRDYSKSVNVAPFIINYSGSVFREYPGPWQVMLKQDSGTLACIAEDEERFTLGDAKYEMMEAMGLRTEEEGSTMEFLRRGYKNATWWEEAAGSELEASDAWRS